MQNGTTSGDAGKPGTISNGTEQNGTEPEVIVAQYGCGHQICYGKLVLICQAYQCTES